MKLELIGKQIKAIREAKCITQAHLADRCHISRRTLSSLESGKTENATIETLFLITEELGVSLASLFIDDNNGIDLDEEARIARANYLNRDPSNAISTFIELVLALPAIDFDKLLDCCARLSGTVVDHETYAAELFSQALKGSISSDAKEYVYILLELMHNIPCVAPEDLIDVLHDRINNKLRLDPEFKEMHKVYLNEIRKKQAAIQLFNQNTFHTL